MFAGFVEKKKRIRDKRTCTVYTHVVQRSTTDVCCLQATRSVAVCYSSPDRDGKRSLRGGVSNCCAAAGVLEVLELQLANRQIQPLPGMGAPQHLRRPRSPVGSSPWDVRPQ